MKPLATRLRPNDLSGFVGQSHLLGEGKPLRRCIEEGHLHSLVFWGPPGTGKTTLAYVLAMAVDAVVETLSAVLAGVKDIREVVARAEQRLKMNQRTILFVDEVHRFNKAQQDAFLPHVEAGTIVFMGATTENPSFQLNNALLSRVRVYVLKSLTQAELDLLLTRALTDEEQGLGRQHIKLDPGQRKQLIQMADGDARQLLGMLEVLADFAETGRVTDEAVASVFGVRRFDQGGDYFYDLISALHKSVRGSDPDAALYWFARMVDGGCDLAYLARRLARMASEDIGNADPRALHLVMDAWQAYERIGSPEGELMLAQAVIYLACAAKSNASYLAYKAALQAVRKTGSLPVPERFRNAPKKLMKDLGFGKGYQYAHDHPGAFVVDETYFPDELPAQQFYQPVSRGLEIKIKEKLDRVASLKA